MKKAFYIFCCLSLVIISCAKDEEHTASDYTISVNKAVFEIMIDQYLWAQHTPYIDPASYDEPQQYIEQLRYKNDKWSSVVDVSFANYLLNSQRSGHGFGLISDNTGAIYVAYVFKNTPAYYAQVKRGWKIESVNNVPANSTNYNSISNQNALNNFVFKTPDGNTISKQIEKKEISVNPIVKDTVFTTSGFGKVGYLMFQSFIDTADYYLDQVFETFNRKEVSWLVVDLRYNGGGLNTITNYLGNLIAGKQLAGDAFYSVEFNERYGAYEDTTFYFSEQANSLQTINAIYFITTSNTASASEVIINGLVPYLDVYLIGSATGGKPVGMNMWAISNEHIIVPVTHRLLNANKVSDYFSGLPVDADVNDNVFYALGKPEEPCLKAALEHIESGSFSAQSRVKSVGKAYKLIEQPQELNNFIILE